MRLKLLPKLNTPTPEGVVPVALSDAGVLCVIDEEDTDGEGSAIELTTSGDSFEPLPELSSEVAFHHYITGPSGVGKSSQMGQMLARWKSLTNGLTIIVSCDSEPDKVAEADLRMSVDDACSLTLDDIKSDDGGPVCVAFDDHLGGTSKEALEGILRLHRAIIERGRKFGISSITTAHRPTGGSSNKEARYILNGLTHYTLFPMLGASRSTRYALDTYMNLPGGELISLLRRHPNAWGRATTLRVSHPQVAIGKSRAMLLDPETIEGAAKGLRKRIKQQAAEQPVEDDGPHAGAAAIARARITKS